MMGARYLFTPFYLSKAAFFDFLLWVLSGAKSTWMVGEFCLCKIPFNYAFFLDAFLVAFVLFWGFLSWILGFLPENCL